ncbi:MAG TPA: YHS domain-containing protein [Desulfobulbus sp.]|nr:YHS domain-containing protein [Desulfobulbus sp.]
MSPIRLLILAVLFYIAWRLLRGLGKDSSPGRRSGKQGSDRVQDVLVEDPVCHTLVPKHQALQLRRGGVTYYFCCERCRQEFEQKSDRPAADE